MNHHQNKRTSIISYCLRWICRVIFLQGSNRSIHHQQKQVRGGYITLSSPTGPRDDFTMFATAWQAITGQEAKFPKFASSTHQEEKKKLPERQQKNKAEGGSPFWSRTSWPDRRSPRMWGTGTVKSIATGGTGRHRRYLKNGCSCSIARAEDLPSSGPHPAEEERTSEQTRSVE